MRTTLLILTALLATTATAAPLQLHHQGRLFDATGGQIDGPHDLTVTLYDAPTSGNVLWTDTMTAVDFTLGYYSIDLGSGQALSATTFDNSDIWLQLAVDGGAALSRVKLASVPFALQAQRATSAVAADSAQSVSGGLVDATELHINGTPVINASGELLALSGGSLSDLSCTSGQVPTYNGASWGCGPALPAHSHALSDGTGVLDAAQMPTDAVELAATSTVDGVDIATTDDVTAAIGGIARHHYTGSIIVDGDANTYYPVCVSKPSETTQLMCDLRVFRGYNQTAPSSWNTSTHKGGLAFWLETNCGSAWSGQPRASHVKWFEETYTTVLAKYTTPIQGCSATCVYLRGGGAYYSFEGNFPGIENPTAYMNPSGSRDMCSPSEPPYNPPLETPVTTQTLSHVEMN